MTEAGWTFRKAAFPLCQGLSAEITFQGLAVEATDLRVLAQYILLWETAFKAGVMPESIKNAQLISREAQ